MSTIARRDRPLFRASGQAGWLNQDSAAARATGSSGSSRASRSHSARAFC